MLKNLSGLLFIAFLLQAAPVQAQLGLPPVTPMQGDGPLTRAKKAMGDADQLNQDSRNNSGSNTARPATKSANTKPPAAKNQTSGPVGSTGVNSSKGKKMLSAVDKEAMAAAKSGLENTYREKLEEGANPMARDESGSTALHLASYKGHTGLVQLLAQTKGVLIDARDDAGNTPLQLAAAAGKDEVVPVLLKAGADPNLKNSDGTPPLHRAAQRGFYSVVNALLQGGADPRAKDPQGRTAAMLVEKTKKGNWEEAARVLREAEKSASSSPIHP